MDSGPTGTQAGAASAHCRLCVFSHSTTLPSCPTAWEMFRVFFHVKQSYSHTEVIETAYSHPPTPAAPFHTPELRSVARHV